ncbi:MAG TPA: PP2C family serine/threonine-protein phosphatase [Polyangiaceae bacterium]|nr:PP2C family serine/threonine-protein phosphatase [Polyangiaceae bacterium]
MSAVGRTDVGLVRANNEDAFLLGPAFGGRRAEGKALDRQIAGREGLLLAVSDGMGGAQAGEVASALVVRSLRKLIEEAPHDEGQVDAWLGRVVERVSTRVWESARRSGRSGMGATLTALYLRNGFAHVAEVGDSRAYLLRGGRLHQVTHDQSYVQVLLDAGVLTPSEARTFPLRNVILQTMGQGPGVAAALTRVALCQGDIFLLCSDGLTGAVNDDELRDVMSSSPSLDKVATRLVDLANERGGDDNITVVLSRVEAPTLPAPAEVSGPVVEIVREYRPRRVVF